MFTVTGSIPVQDPGRDPNELPLDRAALWDGLVRKAEEPVRFVPSIESCRVLERGEGWLVREVVLLGEIVRERVSFHPRERVHFERLPGCRAQGTIDNIIEEDAHGALSLRFTFALEVEGLAHGSVEEQAFVDRMQDSYLAAIQATLDETRRLLAE